MKHARCIAAKRRVVTADDGSEGRRGVGPQKGMTMATIQIGNERLRIEDDFPSAVDIDCNNHTIVATAYDYILAQEQFRGAVEVRQKGGMTALIVYRYSDTEIPAWWRDAELVYSSMPDRVIATADEGV